MSGRGPYRRDPGWHDELIGTERGHKRHERYGETPCDPCREAYNRAAAARRARRRDAARAHTRLVLATEAARLAAYAQGMTR